MRHGATRGRLVALMRALGLADGGGAVRAGVVCYTTDEEVDRLLACL